MIEKAYKIRVCWILSVVIVIVTTVGCSSKDDSVQINKDTIQQQKADGIDLCEEYGFPPGCDLCEEFGWYGDGICDQNLIDLGICKGPDPDCGNNQADGGLDGNDEDGEIDGGSEEGDEEDVGIDDGGDQLPEIVCHDPVPLPEKIEFVGEPSAVAVEDLNKDGCRDIVLIEGDSQWYTLVILWGDPQGTWSERWTHNIIENDSLRSIWWTRDTTSQVIGIGDWDGDGDLDVGTSMGVALNRGAKNLDWHQLPTLGAKELLRPVAFVDLEKDGTIWLVTTTTEGIERCTAQPNVCDSLPHTPPPEEKLDDMVIGDFDHDGLLDIIAGGYFNNPFVSWSWHGSDNWQEPVLVDEMHSKDYEIGDVDDDGFLDIVAQKVEWISDFPSYTDIWISKPDGFEKVQTLYNYDNHNDSASLVDIDQDGCLDYLQIGVDIGVGLRWGNCTYFEEHDGTNGWIDVEAHTGIGVQCLDITGDDQCELIIRSSTIDNGQHTQGYLYFYQPPTHE
jgi:hypothetical protein